MAILLLRDSVHFLLMPAASLPLVLLGGGIGYCDNSIPYVRSDSKDLPLI